MPQNFPATSLTTFPKYKILAREPGEASQYANNKATVGTKHLVTSPFCGRENTFYGRTVKPLSLYASENHAFKLESLTQPIATSNEKKKTMPVKLSAPSKVDVLRKETQMYGRNHASQYRIYKEPLPLSVKILTENIKKKS